MKNVTKEDWKKLRTSIHYAYENDSHFAEVKNAELMQDRMNLLRDLSDYAGKYYSHEYIRKHILRQTDDEIIEQDKLINQEKEAGIIPPTPEEMEMAQQILAQQGDLGKPVTEPEVDETSIEAPESPGVPKGGDI